MMKNNIKIRAEISIPKFNLKGEIKPLKSNELLYQLEDILRENELDYTICISAYKESDDLSQNVECLALK